MVYTITDFGVILEASENPEDYAVPENITVENITVYGGHGSSDVFNVKKGESGKAAFAGR